MQFSFSIGLIPWIMYYVILHFFLIQLCGYIVHLDVLIWPVQWIWFLWNRQSHAYHGDHGWCLRGWFTPPSHHWHRQQTSPQTQTQASSSGLAWWCGRIRPKMATWGWRWWHPRCHRIPHDLKYIGSVCEIYYSGPSLLTPPSGLWTL